MENNKNMTAVEWLVNELENHYVNIDLKNIVAYNQAKQMEREQIIEFADEYADAVMGACINRAEEYYKETYGN